MRWPRTVAGKALLSNTKCTPCRLRNRFVRPHRRSELVFQGDNSGPSGKAPQNCHEPSRDRTESTSNTLSEPETTSRSSFFFTWAIATGRKETPFGPLALRSVGSKAILASDHGTCCSRERSGTGRRLPPAIVQSSCGHGADYNFGRRRRRRTSWRGRRHLAARDDMES